MKFKEKASKVLPNYVRSILLRLETAGYEAYVVGGCVRDLILGLVPHDWDITTNAKPKDVIKIFSRQYVIPTGLKHGTVNVLCDKESIEVTTFRSDGEYTDNRRPDDVIFVSSLKEDLARRDFTMNAIAMSSTGDIFDFFNGTQAIENKIIACVGNPKTRFGEDALRILRAVRFASVLGFSIEDETKLAMLDEATRLECISFERKNAELTKMLCGKNAAPMLIEFSSLIAQILPEIKPMIGFDQQNRHHCFDLYEHTVVCLENTSPEPVLRWAALLHDIGKPNTFTIDDKGEGHFYGHGKVSCELARDVLNRFKFDTKSKNRILLLIKYHDADLIAKKTNVRKWLAKLGEEPFFQLVDLKRADNLAQSPEYQNRQAVLEDVLEIAKEIISGRECLALNDLEITGKDCKNIGIFGKNIGIALNSILTAVINEEFANERAVLLDVLQEIKEAKYSHTFQTHKTL
jgi:tRNA nucleotidyltransferase (CCA-adding enzyme)